MKKILIIDDDFLAHKMLAAVAHNAFAEATVFFAPDFGEGCRQAQAVDPVDLVLLDLGLPDCSGLDALTRFRERFPHVRVVIVSGNEHRDSVVGSLQQGAQGYVPKTHNAMLMSAALRVVAEGGVYVPPQALPYGNKGRGGKATVELTNRQRHVMRLIAQGFSNREIGAELHLAEDTVKQHARSLYAALGVSSRTEAIVKAAQAGISLD